jgi:hypothetical protein
MSATVRCDEFVVVSAIFVNRQSPGRQEMPERWDKDLRTPMSPKARVSSRPLPHANSVVLSSI